jgi:hypothetical protein
VRLRSKRIRRRVRARRSRRLVTAGFIGGVVAGLVVWSVQMTRCRRDLFSSNPVKRMAALGYLAGQRDGDGSTHLETVHLLNEYVVWEQVPILRRRGVRLLQRLKQRFV